MATREKILVLAMIMAIAYGAYTVLAPAEKESAGNAQDRQMLLDQVKAATDAADQGKLTPRQKHVMQEALQPWPHNPFHRPSPDRTDQEDAATVIPDPLPEFVYQGFLETDEMRLAIINGRAYAPGEFLEESGFFLVQIRDGSVILGYRQSSGSGMWQKEFYLEDEYL